MAATYLWNGKTYTMRQLTEACGKSRKTVHYHLRVHGHLDNLGKYKSTKWVEIGDFANMRLLAEACNRSPVTIRSWHSRGQHDRIRAALEAAQ